MKFSSSVLHVWQRMFCLSDPCLVQVDIISSFFHGAGRVFLRGGQGGKVGGEREMYTWVQYSMASSWCEAAVLLGWFLTVQVWC